MSVKNWQCKNLKDHLVSEKGYFCNPAICNCENGKHAESIIGDSIVICNEIIDTAKTVLIKIYPTKTVTKCALINLCISLFFLLISIIDSY